MDSFSKILFKIFGKARPLNLPSRSLEQNNYKQTTIPIHVKLARIRHNLKIKNLIHFLPLAANERSSQTRWPDLQAHNRWSNNKGSSTNFNKCSTSSRVDRILIGIKPTRLIMNFLISSQTSRRWSLQTKSSRATFNLLYLVLPCPSLIKVKQEYPRLFNWNKAHKMSETSVLKMNLISHVSSRTLITNTSNKSPRFNRDNRFTCFRCSRYNSSAFSYSFNNSMRTNLGQRKQ